jgi:hypothetical protein
MMMIVPWRGRGKKDPKRDSDGAYWDDVLLRVTYLGTYLPWLRMGWVPMLRIVSTKISTERGSRTANDDDSALAGEGKEGDWWIVVLRPILNETATGRTGMTYSYELPT